MALSAKSGKCSQAKCQMALRHVAPLRCMMDAPDQRFWYMKSHGPLGFLTVSNEGQGNPFLGVVPLLAAILTDGIKQAFLSCVAAIVSISRPTTGSGTCHLPPPRSSTTFLARCSPLPDLLDWKVEQVDPRPNQLTSS